MKKKGILCLVNSSAYTHQSPAQKKIQNYHHFLATSQDIVCKGMFKIERNDMKKKGMLCLVYSSVYTHQSPAH